MSNKGLPLSSTMRKPNEHSLTWWIYKVIPDGGETVKFYKSTYHFKDSPKYHRSCR